MCQPITTPNKNICHDPDPHPHLRPFQPSQLLPIAFLHAGGHLAAVLSMSAGAVSFTHIIKASEPVASTAIGPLFGVEMQVSPLLSQLSSLSVLLERENQRKLFRSCSV